MKKIFLLSIFLLGIFSNILGQSSTQGYIIAIEGEHIFIDLKAPSVSVGNILSAFSDGGYMTHPVTKKKIKKEDELLAQMRILEIQDSYSVATAIPKDAISKLKPGMKVQLSEISKQIDNQITDVIPTAPKNKVSNADDIIKRYLKITGLYKLEAKDLSQTYLMKVLQVLHDAKGKSIVRNFTTIASPATKQIYRLASLENAQVALIINGATGWSKVKFSNKLLGSRIVTMRPKDVNNALTNINWLSYISCNENVYTYALTETHIRNGITYMGVELTDKQNGKKILVYFDEKTGLITFRKDNKNNYEEILEYRKYGDYMLPAVVESTTENIKVKIELLQFMPYSLESIRFTKEFLKELKL